MDTLQLLSQALRGVIVAPPGKLLFVADYASIEARVLLWCAQDEDALCIFRTEGADIYCDMASTIYGRRIIPNPDDQPPERRLGKEAILGLGYQMGWKKFIERCALVNITIDEPFSQRVVETYREKYWRVKQYWWDQETAAGEATCVKGGEVFECFPVKWWKEGRFLYCQLPSGRKLAYADPQIKMMEMSWGAKKNTLTYMAVNPKTKKWQRQSCYGGLIVENLVQAISRDCMAEAMLRLEATGAYKPVLTVHDEIVAEAQKDHGDVAEFAALVGQCPDWLPGCPIVAESWAGKRYRK